MIGFNGDPYRGRSRSVPSHNQELIGVGLFLLLRASVNTRQDYSPNSACYVGFSRVIKAGLRVRAQLSNKNEKKMVLAEVLQSLAKKKLLWLLIKL